MATSGTTRVQKKPAATAAKNGFSLISDNKLRQIYTAMLQCRVMEEQAAQLLPRSARNGNSTVGHEATVVGVAVDLLPTDTIAPANLDRSTSLIQGIPPAAILAPFVGPAASGNGSQNGRTRPATIAAQMKAATHAALESKRLHRSDIVVVFSGKGPAAIKAWDRTLDFAGRHHLPMVFVAQQDLAADPAPGKRQSGAPDVSRQAEKSGFPGIPVDGNDVVAVYRVAFEAITRARQGGGPTLIDCRPSWPLVDPLRLMEDYLTRKGLFSERRKQTALENFQRELLKRP
ncbi:MAG TPA: thiamine pyrophosphate-dependent enzyme [Acidisarcina sp.]|nr:thiamine pyrophosphate-dependent enzyme [Acidisarcina sp.]